MTTDETSVAVAETKKHKTPGIPAADQNLSDCANIVSETWLLHPEIMLIWITTADFKTAATQFRDSLDQRKTTGGGRAAVSMNLKTYDTEINGALAYIKIYLKDKYDKGTYTAYLPQFGVIKQGKNWVFPTDRNNRHAALQLTVKAMQAHGFEDKKYGLAYWQDMTGKYATELQLSVNTDSSVANLVSAKNESRKKVQKTLNALVHIIKGNYPDTSRSVLREWGFQKEKY